jgi:hypothetical protein
MVTWFLKMIVEEEGGYMVRTRRRRLHGQKKEVTWSR